MYCKYKCGHCPVLFRKEYCLVSKKAWTRISHPLYLSLNWSWRNRGYRSNWGSERPACESACRPLCISGAETGPDKSQVCKAFPVQRTVKPENWIVLHQRTACSLERVPFLFLYFLNKDSYSSITWCAILLYNKCNIYSLCVIKKLIWGTLQCLQNFVFLQHFASEISF